MDATLNRHRQRARQGGFTLLEVTLALTVFLMMTLMFAAVFPIAVRGAQYSSNYAQAALLAQHKVDQLRAAGYSKLDYTDLYNQGAIDALSSPPATLPYGYTFTGVDNLVSNGTTQGFFPSGSTGTITIVDESTLNSSVPVGQMDYVTVAINWSGAGIAAGSYQVSATIIKMPHR